ncbi:MAG TPA: adenylate/guanylate cyclase domain-containing protein [Candidatus Binatia bacterium]|nr:adenylate/guanylate cyclase domain-containing protein [Candidatus Binatia bacterium]
MSGGRAVFSAQCRICGTALEGPLSLVFRAAGIKRSPRNPNLCNRCGTHVEEGRMVELTVLFADLSSFTELTHDLGAEKTHRVVDAFLRMASDVLAKHGAFIDKYVGDAVMALFNVPLRQDDHARQAVEAASEIRSRLVGLSQSFDLQLQSTAAVASGWARVGRLGSEDSKDYTAIGDVVNIAARLQGKANPGEILISHEAYEGILKNFPNLPAEQLTLKGFREPVIAHRLHPSAAVPETDDTPKSASSQAISLGGVIFGILGAPCAVTTLIGPLAVALGVGTLFGLSGVLAFLDKGPIRIPVLILATLGALANLYTLRRAREIRSRLTGAARWDGMTKLERRRFYVVLSSALITIAVVLFEVVVHRFQH